ncbi:MAG: MFS transporter [Anaerolineales bacterium]|nr:MFS transporter [Anaerolineales bacterium]
MKDNLHPILGEVVTGAHVITPGLSAARRWNIVLLLAGCIALLMTGFGIILPVFARRLMEFGAGVETLGMMTMSFALAQFVAAPFMGSLADRIGRRPLIILALVAYIAANIGFLFAPTTTAFIVVRTFEGALTAGLFPSAMGVIADISPEDERGRWSGILMGAYGAGFIFGPVIGGFLYDGWGFAMPFVLSAFMAVLALGAAIILVPETRTEEIRHRDQLLQRREIQLSGDKKGSLWDSIPRPLTVFGTLLLIDFMIVFSFAFVEPQMIFYFYDQLGWSTIQFGVIVGAYGGSLVISQLLFGRMSDRFARKPVIIIGMLLYALFFLALVLITNFPLMLLAAVISGIGEALVMPALSAYYLDITAERHRSRVLGIKESSASLGGVLGPLLVVGVSSMTTPQGVFMFAFLATLIPTAVALVVLRTSHIAVEKHPELAWALSRNRNIAAHATYRGIVTSVRSTNPSIQT